LSCTICCNVIGIIYGIIYVTGRRRVPEKIRRIVLAYSGGLDTSVILKWLQDRYNAQVIAVVADLGQGRDLEIVRKSAIETGASKVIIKDLNERFVKDFIFRALCANAIYEDKYLLATALSRPLISEVLVEVAKAEGADVIAHGCTGKGNDQVRFEISIAALAPNLNVLAPIREWELGSRQEEIEYAKGYGIPLSVTKESPYSIDRNLWGASIECGVLEDPWSEPPEDVYQMTVSPENAPDNPTYLEIYFKDGIPKRINGKEYKQVDLITELNEVGGANGVGRVDHIENRVIGIKSREIYEAPAGTILYLAHKEIENFTIIGQTLQFKDLIDKRYSELIYNGMWHSPLREALDGFIRVTQRGVTGTVRMKLYKGSCAVVGRRSEHSLYSQALATYDKGDIFDQQSAKGFIDLLSLPLKVKARVNKRHVGKSRKQG
jgi:argininosuccinate synthase